MSSRRNSALLSQHLLSDGTATPATNTSIWTQITFNEGFDSEVSRIPGLSPDAQVAIMAEGGAISAALDKFLTNYREYHPGKPAPNVLSRQSGRTAALDYMAQMVIDYRYHGTLPAGVTQQDITHIQHEPKIKALTEGPSFMEGAIQEMQKVPGLSQAGQDKMIGLVKRWQDEMSDGKPSHFPREGEAGRGAARMMMVETVGELYGDGKNQGGGLTASDVAAIGRYPPIHEKLAKLGVTGPISAPRSTAPRQQP